MYILEPDTVPLFMAVILKALMMQGVLKRVLETLWFPCIAPPFSNELAHVNRLVSFQNIKTPSYEPGSKLD